MKSKPNATSPHVGHPRLLRAAWFALLVGLHGASPRGEAGAPMTAEGFAVPQPGYQFTFPADHGSHPDFKIEWWYVTGHLHTVDTPHRRFGFQATFFRQAGPKTPAPAENASAFGKGQLFLAHMALLDVNTGRFVHQERLNRGGWDATAATGTLDVKNGDWSLRLKDPQDGTSTPQMLLVGGVHADVAFTLALEPAKPLVVFGENGVSRKGAAETAASYYLTFTRLIADGELVLHSAERSETLRVTGEAWMDHEISSSQLSSGQVGWDWLSIQFADNRELMLYRLRLRDGSADPASTLTWIDADGHTARRPFTWEVLDRWTSPATGATYPSKIRISTTDPANDAPVSFTAEPLAAAQELNGSVGGIPYWEGACRIRDGSGQEVGSAFMELTGYARDLEL